MKKSEALAANLLRDNMQSKQECDPFEEQISKSRKLIIDKHRNNLESEDDDPTNSEYYSMTEFDETSEHSEFAQLKRQEGTRIEVKDLKKTQD